MAEGFSPRLVVGHLAGEHLSIRPTRRRYPDAQDYWDGNWLDAEITLRVGAFQAAYEAQLRTEELGRFRDALRRLYEDLTGEAAFESMERWLRLQMVGDGRGHITVTGEAMDAPGMGNRLTFQLELDQTELPEMLRALDAILRDFPVKGSPES